MASNNMINNKIKAGIFFTLTCLFSCYSRDMGEVIKKIKLRDKTELTVSYLGGGATAPDAIWISKLDNKDSCIIVDMIKSVYSNTSLVKSFQLNDTLLNLILLDTTKAFYYIDTFEINLNLRIKPNDGYYGALSNRLRRGD